MDLRLHCGRTMTLVGPSGAGKTLFTVTLLQHRHYATLFNVPLKKVWWLHAENEDGDTATQLKKLTNIEYIKGFPPGWSNLPQKHDVVVIDDLFTEADKERDLTNFFTRTARHRNIFVIFLTQNLFTKGGGSRSRNINTHYLVIFKNPRDCLLVETLARQVYGNGVGRKFLCDAFRDATRNKAYGYLFIDFTQDCPDSMRVRTDLFEPTLVVYKQVNM